MGWWLWWECDGVRLNNGMVVVEGAEEWDGGGGGMMGWGGRG